MADYKECAGKSSTVCKDLNQECEKASYNGACPDCEEGVIVYNIPKKPKYEPVPPSGANYVQDPNYVHTDNNFTDEYKDKIDDMVENAQADWDETDPEAPSYIKNKPEDLVQDPDYHHTDNNYTDEDKDKLASVEEGAQKNVQSDWNQDDNTADDYIKNKPTITSDFRMVVDFNYSSSIEITHNAGKFPSVNIIDSGGNTLFGDITYLSLNALKIEFSEPVTGKVHLN